MDGRIAKVKVELETALKAAATAAAELQRLSPEQKNIPHYSTIEEGAHLIGKQLSCLIQQQRVKHIAAEAGTAAKCPECVKVCDVGFTDRTVKSIDGEVELLEPKAHCSRCDRDFFPSTHNSWV